MKNRTLIIFGIIQIFLLIAILLILLYQNGFIRMPQRAEILKSVPQEPIEVGPDDPVWGDMDAPNTLVAYIDFECPYCKDLYQSIIAIEKSYISTGKLRIIFRDMPLSMHENSKTLAQAAECARLQGKFWEFADLALTNHERYSTGLLNSWEHQLQIDVSACMDSSQTKKAVVKDLTNARYRKLKGTPAVIFNNRYYRGTKTPGELIKLLEGKKIRTKHKINNSCG
jgi:protein-disulfide isomerase